MGAPQEKAKFYSNAERKIIEQETDLQAGASGASSDGGHWYERKGV
jgi:hypothetical protein